MGTACLYACIILTVTLLIIRLDSEELVRKRFSKMSIVLAYLTVRFDGVGEGLEVDVRAVGVSQPVS